MAAAQSTNACRPTFADFRASFKLNEPARPLQDLLQAHRLDQTRRDMLQRRLETISSFLIMMELMQERDVGAADHRDYQLHQQIFQCSRTRALIRRNGQASLLQHLPLY